METNITHFSVIYSVPSPHSLSPRKAFVFVSVWTIPSVGTSQTVRDTIVIYLIFLERYSKFKQIDRDMSDNDDYRARFPQNRNGVSADYRNTDLFYKNDFIRIQN